ncbi:MAG: DUF2490 domain-containing protein [Bacteroidota bacterium]|nr:DUF2490 domain-containing protein [Bacteroidota bacterium]
MKRLLLSITILLAALPSFSQTDDFGSWFTFGLNKDIGKKSSISFDQEFRLKENLSTINLFYTNIGFNYKVTKFFKVALVYRMINKQKNDGSYGMRSRIYTDLIFKTKPGKWTLDYRTRLQAEWRQAGYYSEFGNTPEIFLRNLFKVGYEVGPHLKPYAATELRWQIQNPRLPWANGFDRQRLIAGADYKINNMHTIGTYFLFQKEYNVNDPQTLYILGLEYTISLD